MARNVETILGEVHANRGGIKFSDACKVADHVFGAFGKPRIAGSHRI